MLPLGCWKKSVCLCTSPSTGLWSCAWVGVDELQKSNKACPWRVDSLLNTIWGESIYRHKVKARTGCHHFHKPVAWVENSWIWKAFSLSSTIFKFKAQGRIWPDYFFKFGIFGNIPSWKFFMQIGYFWKFMRIVWEVWHFFWSDMHAKHNKKPPCWLLATLQHHSLSLLLLHR